jgi:hypothetical protein
MPTALVCISRIAVRSAWLNIFLSALLSQGLLHAVQLLPQAVDSAACLLPLVVVHLRRRLAQPPAGAAEDGSGHLQVPLQSLRCWRRGADGALCFQKQSWGTQNALAHRPRPGTPGGVELPGFAAVAMTLPESGGHLLAIR